jgi:hypothetical protein
MTLYGPNGELIPDTPLPDPVQGPDPLVKVRINDEDVVLPRSVAEGLLRDNDRAKSRYFEEAKERWMLTRDDLAAMEKLADPVKASAYAADQMFRRWRLVTLENARLRQLLSANGIKTR